MTGGLREIKNTVCVTPPVCPDAVRTSLANLQYRNGIEPPRVYQRESLEDGILRQVV